ncbi:MAG: hypothetical protein V1788_03405 [Nanoarchaeota archaeon]
MGTREGKIVLRRKEELTYELTLEDANYESPFFPISIYCDKLIENHFIIKRKDPPEFESPQAKGITSALRQDGEIGIAHSKEELVEKMYKRAIKLGRMHSEGTGLEFIDKTKEEALEKILSD